jgi:hypothetical protein
MNLNELTIGEAKQLAQLLVGGNSAMVTHPYTIGQAYLIRTVTHYYVGRLVYVHEHELVLEDCAWVADTGRFSSCLADGDFDELEPYPAGRVVIGRGALIDAAQWEHEIPRQVK